MMNTFDSLTFPQGLSFEAKHLQLLIILLSDSLIPIHIQGLLKHVSQPSCVI